ncbi:TPA: YjiK family protein [Salmonella enterica subsp. enterica serovar Gallinarum]|uniref:SdiA-regulated domain-containing protein n=1 Tax=Salmonella enterica TaxID=28901 RepID=UPI0009A99444|nr:YjiK family protein [Salmonella enterica]QUZ42256.1 YjiK family protein [Salmonella enterica subsp. enterica serovar Pullorum str. CFSAN000606]HBZ5832013.1 YjiK family protein [Salmonella enterica subsp. enterica serovar Gallinarum]HBZ5850434.1 YjiK family protein [Salmonella enterica subsp. enterica serovar Gallinarum]HBZ5859252.1 YjiK family protein [Salmonella enterica subsp. enterica serovar Gallinarum]HBZ5933587.1 YjiK family protein [Salmonella enterica subsp. enterica serovar Gallina
MSYDISRDAICYGFFMRLLKRVIVVVLLGVILFMVRDDIRYVYQLILKYGDKPSALALSSYKAVIQQKPVAGVKSNLSGLTYSAEDRMLFAVINNPPELVWLTTEGQLVGRMPLQGIHDPESIAWSGGNQFQIGSEKDGAVYKTQVDIQRGTMQIISMVKLEGYDKAKNKGLEGTAWDAKNERLYAAKERKPIMIKEVEMKNGITRALPSAITASVSDVSGLEYHALTDSLLVLSDESKMILEVSSEWRVRDRLFLTAEWSGLRDDIPQPEGIAMDNENNLYIVSEPNLFYKFSCDIQND